jgi:hypothetical protein
MFLTDVARRALAGVLSVLDDFPQHIQDLCSDDRVQTGGRFVQQQQAGNAVEGRRVARAVR